MRQKAPALSTNTPIHGGVMGGGGQVNRFSGFTGCAETAEAVEETSAALETLPLKWGVNDNLLLPDGPDTESPLFRKEYHFVKNSGSHPF